MKKIIVFVQLFSICTVWGMDQVAVGNNRKEGFIIKGIKDAIVKVDVKGLSKIFDNKKNSTEYGKYSNSTNYNTNSLIVLLHATEDLKIKEIARMLSCARLLFKNGQANPNLIVLKDGEKSVTPFYELFVQYKKWNKLSSSLAIKKNREIAQQKAQFLKKMFWIFSDYGARVKDFSYDQKFFLYPIIAYWAMEAFYITGQSNWEEKIYMQLWNDADVEMITKDLLYNIFNGLFRSIPGIYGLWKV